MLKSPCYDASTKTDCPRRCGGCQVNCPDWDAYLKARDEEYKRRKIENAAKSAACSTREAHFRKLEKRKMSDRTRRYSSHDH